MSFVSEESSDFIELKPVPIYHPLSQVQGLNELKTNLDPATQNILTALLNQKAALEQQIMLMRNAPSAATGPDVKADMPVGTSTAELANLKDEEDEYIEEQGDLFIDVPEESPEIFEGALFSSFAEFETAFNKWKKANFFVMRIASSETLRDSAGRVEPKFLYKFAVYHCIHYGKPRKRGTGARPNQSYVSCGCLAVLRIVFNYEEQVLRVSKLNSEHRDHPVTEEHYKAANSSSRNAVKRFSINSSCSSSAVSSRTSSRLSFASDTMETSTTETCVIKLADFKQEIMEAIDLEPFVLPEGPAAKIAKVESFSKVDKTQLSSSSSNQCEEAVIDVPAIQGLPKIETGAEYNNWDEFETAFEHWKSVGKHPMRIASSETMKGLDGTQNAEYKYKNVVYHCAHYGIPRIRGNVSQSSDKYLASGCGSMLRIGYNYHHNTLRVNKMVEVHCGHSRERNYFERVAANIKTKREFRGSVGSSIKPTSPVGNVNHQPAAVDQNGTSMEQIISLLLEQQKATQGLLANGLANPSALEVLGQRKQIIEGLLKSTNSGMDLPASQNDVPAQHGDLPRPIALYNNIDMEHEYDGNM